MGREAGARTAARVRMFFAIGLLIQFVGFIYDWMWHAHHLQIVPIPPSKLLTVHSGIYLGGLVIVGTIIAALVRRPFTSGAARAALAMSAIGIVVEFVGNGTDMWAHGHGYERDLYHNLIYTGAVITILGYLALQLHHLFTAHPGADTHNSSEGQEE